MSLTGHYRLDDRIGTEIAGNGFEKGCSQITFSGKIWSENVKILSNKNFGQFRIKKFENLDQDADRLLFCRENIV